VANRIGYGTSTCRAVACWILVTLACSMPAVAEVPPLRLYRAPDGVGTASGGAGSSVAIHGDAALVAGTTGAVGAFRKVGGVWQRESILLPPTTTYANPGVALAQDLAVVSVGGFDVVVHTYVHDGTWAETDSFVAHSNFVAVSGDTLLVGNVVYVRADNTWTQQAVFDLDPGEGVCGVAVDGDVAAICTSVFGTGTSHVAFYARTAGTWAREQRMDFDSPGPAIAVSGQTAIVSGPASIDAYVRDQGQWTHEGILDPLAFGAVGGPVALEGDRAVVGSPGDSVFGFAFTGSVYAFERNNGVWTRSGHFTDEDITIQGEMLGSSVALSGDTVLAGAPGANTEGGTGAGNAHVFDLVGGTWEASATFDLGTEHLHEAFGKAVAATPSMVAIGAPLAPLPGQLVQGAIDVYSRTSGGWAFDTRVRAPAGAQGFAASLAMSADTLATGAIGDDGSNGVYVFVHAGGSWTLQAHLDGGALEPDSNFAWSVALSGEVLAAGEPGPLTYVAQPTAHGRVRLFTRTGAVWSASGIVEAADGAAGDEFGRSVALDGSTLAIGSPHANLGIDDDAGAVYVYVANGSIWNQQAKIVAPIAGYRNGFGYAVALVGDTLVVGAADDDGVRGTAYVYVREGGAWNYQASLSVTLPSASCYAQSVALSPGEDLVLVGASQAWNGPAGYAYAFRRDGASWAPAATWRSPGNEAVHDGFGQAVAFSGADALIGSPDYGSGGSVFVAPMGMTIFADGFESP